ncbi:Wzz/FepE/Etk N-terminal domain-containing protein [Inhella inkyongensis]|nr:Wzz/FepE/Etk N-terminal domain-containing protein [Inhella inkyongensis]
MSEIQTNGSQELGTLDYVLELARHSRLIVLGGLLAGVLAVAGSFLVKPTFTSRAVVLPPVQPQSGAGAALASLGALAGLPSSSGRGPDQFVSLLLSANVADRMIERFDLMQVYDSELRIVAREEFWRNLRVIIGRRDGLIVIEVDDKEPSRAAAMAEGMVDEFRRVSNELAISEAQQRRKFFEVRRAEAAERLQAAQEVLQRVGFAAGSLKAEPKAAAENYARLRAETTAAEIRVKMLLSTMTEQAPEVQQQLGALAALRVRLQQLERVGPKEESGDYITRFREYKYQEALLEQFSRQYELARVDEGREGGLLQVVDAPQVPERKSRPKRAMVGISVSLGVGLLLTLWVIVRFQLRCGQRSDRRQQLLRQIWPALRGHR